MIAALLTIVGVAFVLWWAVRWDLNRRHRAMVGAAKVAVVQQARAKIAEIDARFPGNSRRQIEKRLAARKNLRAQGRRKGSALLEAVLSLGALALITSAAFGSAALARLGWGGLGVVLWGCGLAVFCAALARWAPALESKPPPEPSDHERDSWPPFDGYSAGRPEGGRPGLK